MRVLPTYLDADFDSWMSPEEDINLEEEDNGIEVRALELLNFVRATGLTPESCEDKMEDKLILDFFREELAGAQRNNQKDDEFDREIVSKAEAWISGKYIAPFEWGVEHKKEAFVRDMQKGGKWNNKFEDEQEELALEIETAVLEFLVDELSVDLLLQ